MSPTISKSPLNPNPNFSFPIFSSLKPQFSVPLKPSFLRTPKALTLKIRSSQNPTPTLKNPIQTLISTAVKPAIIATIAAASVFLSRHPPAAIAATTPIVTQSEALTEKIDEQALESQLQSNPNDISALRSLMELKVKSKKLPEAIEIVDRLIHLEPTEHDLPLLKSHLLSYSGELDAAKSGFEEILKKNPYIVEAYHGLVMMASQTGNDLELIEIIKRVEAAMVACEKEKKKEELKDFKLLIAQVKVIEGKYVEALKIYDGLVKEEPRDFRPYLCQGIIYTLMRKKDEAEKYFEKYRKLVPKGHPYAQFFDHNMNAMKGFSPME